MTANPPFPLNALAATHPAPMGMGRETTGERHLFTINATRGWRCTLCDKPEHHAIHVAPKVPSDRERG